MFIAGSTCNIGAWSQKFTRHDTEGKVSSHIPAPKTFFYMLSWFLLRLQGRWWPERMSSLGPAHIRQKGMQSNVQAQQKTVHRRSWMQPRPAKKGHHKWPSRPQRRQTCTKPSIGSQSSPPARSLKARSAKTHT